MKNLLLSILLLPLFSHAQFTRATGYVTGNQTVIPIPVNLPGYALAQALIYYPDDYFKVGNETKRYPVMFFLHGAGEGGSNDIVEVNNNGLPQLIAQGLKPYGIDTLTGDTIKFIVISPHAASTGWSYSWPQLQYTIPFCMHNYRIDSTCMWLSGLSAGGEGTVGFVMSDTTLGQKLAGVVEESWGLDNRTGCTFPKMDTNMRRNLCYMYIIGDQDQSYNALGYQMVHDTVSRYAQPNRYYEKVVPGGAHNSGVWNLPWPLTSRTFNATKNTWSVMSMVRRSYTIGTLTATAGNDQTITLPTNSTTLNGSGTTPGGTTITGYAWTRVSGPNTPTATGAATATLSLSGMIQGSYVYQLTVTNSASATATDNITITVNAAPATPPTANAGSNQSLAYGTASTSLVGTGSTPAAGHTLSSYLWTKISGAATTLTNATSASATVSGLAVGSYIFSLQVTDNIGQTDTAQVLVTVNPQGFGANVVKKVACSEYKAAWLYTDGSVRTFSYNATSGHVELMPFLIAGRTAVDISTGFNRITILDDQGYVWINDDRAVTCKRFDTDTTSAAGNGFTAIFGYFYTYLAIRSDGSIWYAGADDYHWFGSYASTVHPITKWLKINQPAGTRFVKLACGNSILGLTSTGDVYEWDKGSTTYTKVTLPKPATDVAASHTPFNIAIVPNDTAVSKAGFPYAWGSESVYWGGNGSTYLLSAPSALKTLWSMTYPIKEITANQNVITYIDSLGDLYGIGDNPNGEIGNGKNSVIQWNYPTPYAWSWVKYEALTGAPPIHVAIGTKFKKIFTSNTFNFYHYALDVNDSLYFWGRNKSFVGGNGAVNADESAHPNYLDVVVPSMRTPLAVTGSQTTSYTPVPGSLNPGINQVISTSLTTLSAFATPLTLTASGKPNYGYTIVKYHCDQVAGPNTATIVTPDAQSTVASGLIAGTYVFRWTSTDSQGGTLSGTMMVVVNAGPNLSINCNCRPRKTFIRGKTISQ